MTRMRNRRGKQRGAVAIIVGLAIVVLVAFAGLALDLGQMFISKTELQNAADACALAAARELNTAPTTLSVLTRSENAGISVGVRNKTAFQKTAVEFATDRDVTFSNAFAGDYVTKGAAPPDTRYVRCSTRRSGIVPWFMQVIGIGEQTVPATAVASLQGSSKNTCMLPLGMCKHPPTVTCSDPGVTANANGLCKGQWYDGRFSSGGGATGNFNWLDFSPPSGGASELKDVLIRCKDPVDLGSEVHAETGIDQGVATAWNSLFGLYKNGSGQPSPETAAPDFTGYAYTTTNWSSGRDAYSDFLSKRTVFAPYDGSDGLGVKKSYQASTPETHRTRGSDRRLVNMPIVDCTGWGPKHKTTVAGVACALILTPNDGPNENIVLEFRAQSGDADNPCATFGQPAGPSGTGPRVPNLVQ